MGDEMDELRERVHKLESKAAGRSGQRLRRGKKSVRTRSKKMVGNWPLYDVAIGPDPTSGEVRGHARGIFALGDIATGVFALGGIARGLIAVGGVAVGGLTLGGYSFGLLLAVGGVALGAVAFGGVAVGLVAVGGAAVGYYAGGGAAWGQYVASGREQDPEATSIPASAPSLVSRPRQRQAARRCG